MRGSKRIKQVCLLTFGAALLAVYYLLLGCPIKLWTGISCAGCGMTRAWLCVLHLDFAGAFAYHPLYWLPPVVLAVYLLRAVLPRRLYRGLLAAAAVAFIAVYGYRMWAGSGDIVVFAPQNSLPARFISQLAK